MDSRTVSDVLNEFVQSTQPQSNTGTQVPNTATQVDALSNTGSQVISTPNVDTVVDTTTTANADDTSSDVNANADDVNWDSFVTDTPGDNQSSTDLNWSEVGKALNLKTEVKSSQDVIGYIGTLEKTIQDLKTTSFVPDKMPEELKEALKIAENGGDYKAYLEVGQIDYNKIDPVELYEDEVAEDFYNADGSFDQEGFDTYIESIHPKEKLLRGKQIQRALAGQQAQQKQLLVQKANFEKAENLKKLETSLNQFTKVGEFQVTPKVKKQLYDDFSSGQFMRELGISINGAHDWDKLKETYFKAKYFDAVQQFNEKRAKTSTTREIINGISNSTVGKPSGLENPVGERPKKTGIDLYLESLEKR